MSRPPASFGHLLSPHIWALGGLDHQVHTAARFAGVGTLPQLSSCSGLSSSTAATSSRPMLHTSHERAPLLPRLLQHLRLVRPGPHPHLPRPWLTSPHPLLHPCLLCLRLGLTL